MPDWPGFAATRRATARPRRVSSVAASAVDGSRSTFFGRLAQPETSKPSAIATRKHGTETDADATRAIGLWAVICASTDSSTARVFNIRRQRRENGAFGARADGWAL